MPHKISVQRIQQFQRGELWCKRLNGAALVRKNILSSCVVWYDRSHVSEPESVVQRDRVAAAIVSRPDCDWLGCEKRRQTMIGWCGWGPRTDAAECDTHFYVLVSLGNIFTHGHGVCG